MLYNYKKNKHTYCRCKCDCGNEIIVASSMLKRKGEHSCGCAKKQIAQKNFGTNVNGKQFGNLFVVETLWNESPVKLKCKCDCGNDYIGIKRDIVSGHTRSCGCLHKTRTRISNTKDFAGRISSYGIKLIKRSKKNNNGVWLWECECGLCNSHFTALPAKIFNGHITSCGCAKSSSKERLISSILQNHQVNFKEQFSIEECKYKYVLRFDFAIFKNDKLQCLIEYDGKQHYIPIPYWGGEESLNLTQIRDKIKNDYCQEAKIPLYRLPYTLTDSEIEQTIINVITP